MDFANWHLRDTAISARGAKSCQVRTADTGDKVSLTVGTRENPVTTPFGATSFNEGETSRKTLELSLSAEEEQLWVQFDIAAVQYIAKHSSRLFKKTLTEEQVRENYRSPMTKKADYKAHLRCKIQVEGTHIVRCWDMARERTSLPEDLRGVQMVCKVQLSHMWQMSKEYGFVFQVTDLMLHSSAAECPFEDGAFGGA